MSLIDRLKRIFKEEQPTKIVPTGYETGLYFPDELGFKKTEFLLEMKGWVGACVGAIADEIGSINIRLYKFSKGDVEEVAEHEVLDVLWRVNDYTTKFDHFWLTQTYLELTGEAPWYIERGKNGKVQNVYFLRPDRLSPKIGKSKLIEGYLYDIGGQKISLTTDEVLFLKQPDPANPFRGLGTLSMAARIVDIDNFSEEWNKSFYQNAARPDTILNIKVDQMTSQQKDILKSSIKETYQGFKKAHQMMVLFGDMDLKTVGFSQKDMDFAEQQKFSRDKILGIFRVPKAVIAQTEEVNYASAKTAQYVFARWTIQPKMEKLIQQMNEFFLPMFKGTEQMFLDYDNPIPADDEALVVKYESALRSGWMTINEVRTEENLPEVEGGDTIYLPFGLSAIGSNPEEITEEGFKGIKLDVKKSSKKEKDAKRFESRIKEMRARNKTYFKIEKVKSDLTQDLKEKLMSQMVNGKHKTKDMSTKPQMSDEQKMIFWQIKNALFKKHLKNVYNDLVKVFQEQRKQVLGKLNSFKEIKVDSTAIYNAIKLNKTKEIERTLSITLPDLVKLFKEAGDETFRMLEVEMEIDIDDPKIQKLLRNNGRKFASGAIDTTNNKIKSTVMTSVAGGESIDTLSDKLKAIFVDAESFRADRIARTETLRYNAGATEQAFLDSGVVEGKEWYANPDACEYCAPLAGKIVDLGDSFYEKGDIITNADGRTMELDYDTTLYPPLHPNCECDLVPVFIGEKSFLRSDIKEKLMKKYSSNN